MTVNRVRPLPCEGGLGALRGRLTHLRKVLVTLRKAHESAARWCGVGVEANQRVEHVFLQGRVGASG